MDYLDKIEHKVGLYELPGFVTELCFISKDNLQVFAKPANDATGAARVTFPTITPITEKKWSLMKVAASKTGATSETQGTAPYQTSKNKMECALYCTDEKAAELQLLLQRDDVVFAIKDHEGKVRIVGHPDFQCVVKVNINQGKAETDEKLTTITAECSAPCMMFYAGPLVSADGDWNA